MKKREQYILGGVDKADKKEIMQNASGIPAQLRNADETQIMQNSNIMLIQKGSRHSYLKKISDFEDHQRRPPKNQTMTSGKGYDDVK